MGIQDFPNINEESQFNPNPFIFANEKDAFNKLQTKRSLIQWQLPHIGDGKFIEMYVNPHNITFTSRKEINRIRTKGGYITQYWGEDLDVMNLQGTTGSGAIEAINVLRDVYRSEQLALQEIIDRGPSATGSQDRRRQSLMQLAAGVIMWYQGQGYRGYFTDLNYTENADRIGLFDYSINFTVVEILGQARKNFLPWHRHPWSTTNNPNTNSNQTLSGGGYLPGSKVGALNAPPMWIKAVALANTNGSNKLVRVAVLRGDPKDGTIGKSIAASVVTPEVDTEGRGEFATAASGGTRRNGGLAYRVNTLISKSLEKTNQQTQTPSTALPVNPIKQGPSISIR